MENLFRIYHKNWIQQVYFMHSKRMNGKKSIENFAFFITIIIQLLLFMMNKFCAEIVALSCIGRSPKHFAAQVVTALCHSFFWWRHNVCLKKLLSSFLCFWDVREFSVFNNLLLFFISFFFGCKEEDNHKVLMGSFISGKMLTIWKLTWWLILCLIVIVWWGFASGNLWRIRFWGRGGIFFSLWRVFELKWHFHWVQQNDV